MRFKSFDSFINENFSVPVYKDSYDLLNASIKNLKENKKIKYHILRSSRDSVEAEGVSMTNWKFSNVTYPDKKNFAIFCSSDSATPSYLILSDVKIDDATVDEIFPETVNGNSGTLALSFVRSANIRETKIAMIRNKNWSHTNFSPYIPRKFSIFVSYVKSTTEIDSNLPSMFLNSKELKDFMAETGTELLSSDRQKKAGTLVFGKKSIRLGAGLYKTGYVRTIPLNGGEVGVSGKFDPSTLQGWIDGIKVLRKTWENIAKKYS